MNVLCHGVPFCCDWPLLRAYTGEHEIRILGIADPADYRYDPAVDDAPAVVERIARDWPVDLLLCWTPEIYPPPARIEEAPVRTAACVSDWNVYFAALAHNLRRFDAVLCDRPGVAVFERAGVPARYVTPLYSQVPGVHEPSADPKRFDIVFAGNLDPISHPARNAYLARLAALDGDWRIAIREGLEPGAYGRFLASSRAVFNHSIRGELNLRAFETAACGACPTIEAGNAEIRECFDPDRDILVYGDASFEQDIAEALRDEEGFRRRAETARDRAAGLSGANRLDAIVAECLRGQSARSFHALSAFDRAVASAMLYSLGRDPRYFPAAWTAWIEARAANAGDPAVPSLEGQLRFHPFHPGYGTEAAKEEAVRALYEAHRADRGSAVHALNAALAFRLAGRPSMERRCLAAADAADSIAGAAHLLTGPNPSTAVRWRRAWAEGRAALPMLRAEARFRSAQLRLADGDPAAAFAEAQACAQIDPGHREWPAVALQAAAALGDAPAALAAAESAIALTPLRLEFHDARQRLLAACGRTRDASEEETRLARMRARIVTRA